MTSRTFHLGDVLSVMTGRLVSPRHIDGVYDILNHLTGESLMTHQLPRASREAEPVLRERFPDLATIEVPEFTGGMPEVMAWLDEQVAMHGIARDVAPLDAEDHTSIDPLVELRMMRPDASVIVVHTEGGAP
jgi:hypothetical protein